MQWSPRDNMELSQMVLTQPKLRPVQLPWVGKWVSNNVGRPIRCICSINSGMSSTRSVMMWGISFMPRAYRNLIGKYLSSLHKLDHVIVPKEGVEAKL